MTIRLILFGRPIDDTPPKSVPDEESDEARWVTLQEFNEILKTDKLRGSEPIEWFTYLEKYFPCFHVCG